jgi:predicted enzyme related to lactoylglutathione lyase
VGNQVVYFEVGSRDHQALVEFYRDLFGWQLNEISDGYTMIDTQAGTGLVGGVGRSSDGTPWASFYVVDDNPQALLERVTALGGSTVVPLTEIAGIGLFAMFGDLDGNVVGIVGAGSGLLAGRPSPGDAPAVDWFEVIGSDAARTQSFYGEVFGWAMAPGFPGYRLVDTQSGESSIGGGVGGGAEQGTWATVYANVPDVEATLARAEKLGGSRVYGPNPVDDHMKTGALRDPAGNVFGVYEHHH